MITSAIAALKERDGSSKTAIAKYIDQFYTNLPANHSALLSHHIKRLKTNGQLVMVKHSYKLPPSPRSAYLPFPPLNDADNFTIIASSSAQTKRRPGRPAKPKPNPLPPTQPQVYNYPAQPLVGPGPGPGPGPHYNVTAVPTQTVVSQKRKPGRPAKLKTGVTPVVVTPPPPPPVAQSNGGAVFGTEAVFVSLGLADGPPAKKRPGRPRRVDSAVPQQPRPNPLKPSGPKRKPGRPAKFGPWPNGVAPIGPVSGKPRGRPKRNAPPVANGLMNMLPKKRSRKPKNVQQASAGAPAAMFVPHVEASTAVPGAVMVPYAPVPVTVPLAGNGFPPPAAGKRRGRPPRAAGAPKKPRNLTGKRLGRPKKKNTSPPESSQHLAAYMEIKGKLEYLQTRIKQTIGVLKPCIASGLSPHALGALEQLEELVTEAANDAAVNVQGQQGVQQV